jgi:acetyl-CoA carboxylase biotin carboxyl carrier protein
MAREEKQDAGQFDIDGLRQLMELMELHDVREVKLQQGETKYLLRRGPQEVYASGPVPYPAAPVPAAPAPAPVVAAADAGGGAPAVDENLVEIKSPTVGTFYASPSPGDPPFVKVGDQVSPDTTVCIVEAMKVFNQIPSGVSGTVAKVLLTDGDAVEFGQPMFLVQPS